MQHRDRLAQRQTGGRLQNGQTARVAGGLGEVIPAGRGRCGRTIAPSSREDQLGSPSAGRPAAVDQRSPKLATIVAANKPSVTTLASTKNAFTRRAMPITASTPAERPSHPNPTDTFAPGVRDAIATL
jgi:hypothetical protein